MDGATSQRKFQEADQLFQGGRYQEALVILEELNASFPNAKNIMYPAAMCLDKLGRSQEALPLCNHLIQAFQDPRAESLKAEIEGRALGTSLNGMYDTNGLDLDSLNNDILDMPTTSVSYKPVEPEGIPWLKYGAIAAAVIVVLLVVIVPVMTYEAPPPGSEPVTVAADEPVDTTMIYVGMLAFYICIVTFQVAGAYLALMLMRSLPHEDFLGNAFNLFVSFFLASLLESSLFGFFLTGAYFMKVYDLGFGGLVFLYLARILFGAAGFFLGALIFAGSFAHVVQSGGVL